MRRPTAISSCSAASTPSRINQSLYKKPFYNAATDFSPIGLVTDQAMVLIARSDFPANDMKEFAAYAKANHAKMQFASGGVGSGVAPDLRADQCRDRRRSHPCHLSRLGAGDAGFIRRPDRLLLRARRRRGRSAGKQAGQGDRDPDPRPLAAVSGARQRQRAGHQGLPRQFLERAVPAQGRARGRSFTSSPKRRTRR